MRAGCKEDDMRAVRWTLAVTTAILGGMAYAYVAKVQATPASGFKGETMAVGRLGEIDVSNHMFLPDGPGRSRFQDLWISLQKTKGPSDVYVQNNTWEPGGTTGWHTHPGHSLIIVTAGTVTAYEGHEKGCRPHVYTAGMGFVDEGGDHVHVLRNEDSIEARTVAVQLIPAGAQRRADAAGNPNCPF
jgi:quercetin dioxygenase-like cupin family protein